jgi:transcriptional regulator with XRE-family HTH domain
MAEHHARAEYECQEYSTPAMALILGANETEWMNKPLGAAIARLREDRGMTQEDLVAAAGPPVGQSALSKIEGGKQNVTTRALEAIAKGLGVRVSEIWELAERGAAPVAETKSPRKSKGDAQTTVNLDIDALRHTQGAIAVALTAMHTAVGARILKELEKVPAEFLEREGSVVALREAVEGALRAAKARKRPQ